MNGKVRIFLAADPSGKPQPLDEDHKLYWAARVALRSLNYVQTEFAFEIADHKVVLRRLEKGEHYSWSELLGEMVKLGKPGGHYVLIVDQPLEDNWFSRTFIEQRLTIISTWSWEYISDLPMSAFIGYELVENLVERLALKDAADQEWFFQNVVHTDGARGCLNDMCSIKPQISLKMRTGDVCADCMAFLEQKLSSGHIHAILEMLESIRRLALDRGGVKISTEDYLAKQVDGDYPFHIAYCLRMMRSEQTYTRKWLHMYDVYRLIIKYVAFALLSDQNRNPTTFADIASDLAALARGTDGTWGKVTFELVEKLSRRSDNSFFADFGKSLDPDDLHAAQLASKAFVYTRNDKMQGHAFTPPEPVCRQFCEKHFDDLKTLLNFIKPIAKYQMLMPTGDVRSKNSGWNWNGKSIMGSNPTFEVVSQHTKQHPGSDCVLVNEDGDILNLSPWLLLDFCPSCYREMVFLYDKLDGNEAVYREYPTNHMRNNRELGEAVRTILKP